MKLSERIPDILLNPECLEVLKDEVAQLEAENERLRELFKMDLLGLRVIANRLIDPKGFPSCWRDTGTRQRRIGEQLLRLCDALKETE